MFLKSLEVFGFKSFADRSRIEFQEGISALLGPNGCGKSNVVDALKWVIGEQSVKSLRAEKMEDVIFNGTENRKALNIAEVTIVLSNDEGLLPIDMPEIAVKRRLYRTGESEYFLNNTPVKLRELRELFFDTGIGKSAYSVMEQGRIDQILSSKPEERRYIFEEAAGITKYKARGAEADRKLGRTQENIRQVEGIMGEVKRSYSTLKIQAERTERYKVLREESFALERDIQLLKLRGLLEEKNGAEKQRKAAEDERDLLKAEIDAANDFLQNNLDEVNTMESSLVETQKKLYGIGLEKGSCENQINLLMAQKEDLAKQEKTCLEKEEGLKRKISLLKEQISEKEDGLVEFSKRISETEVNIKEFERSIQAAQERIKENDQGIRKREEDISRIEKEILTLQDQLDGITEDIVQQLDTRLKETGYSLKERKATEERLESLLKGMIIQIDGKIQMFRDGAVLKGLEKQDLQNRLTAGADGLEELKKNVAALGEHIEIYKKVIPSFIDEFLAPEGIITKKREIDRQIEGARENISRNRRESESLREENSNLRKKIDEYRTTLEDLRVNRIQLITQRKGMEEALQLLGRDLTAQEGAVVENQLDLENCRHRAGEVQKQVVQKEEERKNLISTEKNLQKDLAELEKGISRKNKDLIAKEKLQKDLTHKVSRVQEAVEKVQILLASLNTDVRNLYENFVERHSRDLSEFESTMYEIASTSRDLKDSLTRVREEEKGLGSINLMAPEEFAEVKERHDFLQGQLEDLGKAKEDLVKITNQIEKESTELFLDTYDKIKKSFHAMFRRLFGGGRAEIRLEDPDDVLNSGIEIFAQPPGKKLENITLLSGGEKSLTAIALLFATYMVKPSPFCILDEIDAAMDDQNIGRFTNLLLEFGSRSQFIIITHNKKTVTAARTLLGVTMEESGVSKIVAVRLEGEGAETEAVEV